MSDNIEEIKTRLLSLEKQLNILDKQRNTFVEELNELENEFNKLANKNELEIEIANVKFELIDELFYITLYEDPLEFDLDEMSKIKKFIEKCEKSLDKPPKV